MRIEIHTAAPTRFQDTKPTVESNKLQTNQSSYIEVLGSNGYGSSFQYDRSRGLVRVLFSTIGSRSDVQPVMHRT